MPACIYGSGNPEAAAQISRQALDALPAGFDPKVRANSNISWHNLWPVSGGWAEARRFYTHAVAELEDHNDLNTAARVLASWGNDYLVANRLDDAESVLSEALRLVRVHRLDALSVVNVLRGLARLEALRGQQASAAILFQSAIDAPPGVSSKVAPVRGSRGCAIRVGRFARLARRFPRSQPARGRDEGRYRSRGSGPCGPRERAEPDCSRPGGRREPARDRGKRRTPVGGDLRGGRTGQELEPAGFDPRAQRLALEAAGSYWDVLARYQSVERAILCGASPELAAQAAALRLSLQQTEAEAHPQSPSGFAAAEPALAHIKKMLDADTILLSFHISKSNGWLWVVDRRSVSVYPVPALDRLKSAVESFARAARTGGTEAADLGSRLYMDLFRAVPAGDLSHKRWLCSNSTAPFSICHSVRW